MTEWTDIGPFEAVPRQGARVVKTPRGCVAIFRAADDRVFALEDRCPHKGGPLSQGIVHGASVTCPLHNWVIDLATGQAEGADVGAARSIPLTVENGRLLLGLEGPLMRKAG